jgi:predicted MPP superfamily phosphohydrolase
MTILIGLGILIASCVGHAEWWVLFINRLHSLAIPHHRLRWTRRLHDVAVPLYPLVLIWQAVFHHQGLLAGGQFRDQSPPIQAILIVTSLGVIPLTAGVLRWQLRHKHAFARADQRASTDLRQLQLQQPDVGDIGGPRRHPSKSLPGNDIFRIEINSKSIRLPSENGMTNRSDSTGGEPRDCPAPGAGHPALRIVHFSDLHFIGCPGEGYYRWLFERAAEMRADAYAFTGDLIDDPELIPLATEILGRLTALAPCFFVLGNHDWRYDHGLVRRSLQETGWVDVASQAVMATVGGRRILVAGNELPWLGTAPPDAHGVAADLKLLLSHSPDQVRFAQRAGYQVMLAGHTHGGQVVLPVIGPVYSPSRFGVHYASGLFEVGSLHLHVSRGIGGKDPLRWRCSPELTCLEIHAPQRSTS